MRKQRKIKLIFTGKLRDFCNDKSKFEKFPGANLIVVLASEYNFLIVLGSKLHSKVDI